MKASLPDQVEFATDDPLRPLSNAAGDLLEDAEASSSSTDSFFEENPTPTTTVTFRRRDPSLSNGETSLFRDFTVSIGSDDGEPKGRQTRDPWFPKLVWVVRHPFASFWKVLVWSWRVLAIVPRTPFWLWATANRFGDALVWRVTGMLSFEAGGRNFAGGYKMTDRLFAKIKRYTKILFGAFCLWILWFYVSSGFTGADKAFVDLPGGLFFSVPKMDSWEEYANHTLSCASGEGEDMETWLATNASCRGSKCLRIGDLAEWLVERTRKDALNFAASTFVPQSHAGNISVPCACAIRLKNGTEVFFLDPLATVNGKERGKITDSVPVLGIPERTRIVPRSVALSFTRWPSKEKKIIRDRVVLSDEDASVALWCVAAVTKKKAD